MKKKIKFPVLNIQKLKIKFPVLNIQQLKLPKFLKFKGTNSSLKSFYYTGLVSLIIIYFFL